MSGPYGFNEDTQWFARFERVELIHWIMNAAANGALGIHGVNHSGAVFAVVRPGRAVVPEREMFTWTARAVAGTTPGTLTKCKTTHRLQALQCAIRGPQPFDQVLRGIRAAEQ